MELLDRYLNAVKRHLPWERQDDIIAELKANLEAQLEDKEAELGRKLGSDEMKAWIKELGPPIQVAARYQPQRYLIGPALFPTYSYVLRLVLTWVTVIYAIANAVAIAARNQGGEAVLQAVLRLPWIWLVNAAVTTLIFAVIEMTGARFPEKFRAFGWVPGSMTGPMTGPMTAPWSPLDLQPADLGDSQWFKPRSFTRALLEFFSGCLFLAYVLLIPHYPYLLFGPGEWYLRSLPYRLAPVWWTFYWLVVGVNTFELAWKVADLARRTWQRPSNRARHLAMNALSLVPLCVLLAAPNHALFLLKNPADTAKLGAAAAAANKGVQTGLTIAIAIVALQLAWRAGKMGLDAYRKRVAAR